MKSRCVRRHSGLIRLFAVACLATSCAAARSLAPNDPVGTPPIDSAERSCRVPDQLLGVFMSPSEWGHTITVERGRMKVPVFDGELVFDFECVGSSSSEVLVKRLTPSQEASLYWELEADATPYMGKPAITVFDGDELDSNGDIKNPAVQSLYKADASDPKSFPDDDTSP